jgi:endonuclease/exonuclease/phosphatase (EEP) superfamily protein YafD
LNLASKPAAGAILEQIGPGGPLAGADFYLLQEVFHVAGQPSVADELAAKLSLHSFFSPSHPGPAGCEIGLAILSRHPLSTREALPLPRFNLTFRSRTRLAQYAVADTPEGQIHLFNVHLDTRINLADRMTQLDPVLQAIEKVNGPVLLGGDFNTNPMRWIAGFLPLPARHSQARGTVDYLAARGFGSALPLGITTHDVPGLQLDWVFTRGLQVLGADIRPMHLSDHHALQVNLDRAIAPPAFQ